MWSPGIREWSKFQLRDHFVDRLAVLFFKPFATCDGKVAWIEAELVQHGGVNVGDVVTVFNGMKTDFVGCAVGDAAFDSSACHPNRETVGMMVTTVRMLRSRRSAEFAAPNDQRFIQHSPLFEVGKQRADGLIDLFAQFCVTGL